MHHLPLFVLVIFFVGRYTNNSRSGEVLRFVSTPVVAVLIKALLMSAGELKGLTWSRRAIAPAACGAAIEVPLLKVVAKSSPFHNDSIPTPGAKISTHGP